jgi:hypothetical protein
VYVSLDHLVGKRVQVRSVETALDDILEAVKEYVPIDVTTMDPGLHHRVTAIAKYGILDVAYGIGSTALPEHRPGLAILRDLSLVDSNGDLDALETKRDFLHDLALESEAGQLYLKLFLETREKLQPEQASRQLRDGLPTGFWPHGFVVYDACLTNARSIWLAKHFYL